MARLNYILSLSKDDGCTYRHNGSLQAAKLFHMTESNIPAGTFDNE